MLAASLLAVLLLLAGAAIAPAVAEGFGALSGRRRIVGYFLLSLLLGVLLDLAVTLLTARIDVFLVAAGPLFLCSLVLQAAGTACFRLPGFAAIRVDRRSIAFFVLLAACLLVLLNGVVFRVLHAWDARSIWFFHAKVMFFDGGIIPETWRIIGTGVEHADYPKLIATLGAQVAWLAGYWNEYEPLSALVVLILIEIALLAYVLDDAGEFLLAFLLAVPLATASPGVTLFGTLTNGYMDAHLAVLAPLALGLLIRAGRKGSPFDLTLGILALGIVSNLKNEGIALVLAVVVWPVLYWAGDFVRLISTSARRAAGFVVALLLAALPVILWRRMLAATGLSGDLFVDGFLARLASRLDVESVLVVLGNRKIWPFVGLYALAALAYAITVRARCRDAEVFGLAALSYYVVLVVIYLGTPYDPGWHAGTSLDRTTLPVQLLLVGGIVTLYRGWRIARPGRPSVSPIPAVG